MKFKNIIVLAGMILFHPIQGIAQQANVSATNIAHKQPESIFIFVGAGGAGGKGGESILKRIFQ
ncbi:hypothetical protein [Dickeya poaceiphila]|uniref:Uncharacterized protein n=1 Tax=Dickeya poaceiphila TaxID=568768 RepID=A0A5B8I3G4_9GAMM|nr:hypothetical protein [Dickeya poaceiphila]QDX29234.1 hypothetical protein Dpoa569_0000967 [Dickeya poaceiphila]